MRMLKLAAATVAFMSLAATAYAGDYWAVSVADEGMMLADNASVAATGSNLKQIDTYAILKTASPYGDKMVDYIQGREEFDCAGQRSRTLRADAYTLAGEKVVALVETPGNWNLPADNSTTREGLKLVCQGGAGLGDESHFGDHPLPQMVGAYRKVAAATN